VADLAVRFHPLAQEEAEGAYAWYAERNLAAANLFLDELDTAVARVREAPHRWPRIRQDIRRYVFRKFPFSLVYRVRSYAVEVIAVAHHRRRPEYLRQR
jgi:plasmid stabilization system protein ParE